MLWNHPKLQRILPASTISFCRASASGRMNIAGIPDTWMQECIGACQRIIGS
ncbi:MAG: hypothetical protein WC353_03755 [Candidatus Peribacter sp.]